MYAGVGHFAPSAMRIAFLPFVFPALLLQYLGQGAQLLSHGDEIIDTIFYSSLRWHGEWVYWIGFILHDRGLAATLTPQLDPRDHRRLAGSHHRYILAAAAAHRLSMRSAAAHLRHERRASRAGHAAGGQLGHGHRYHRDQCVLESKSTLTCPAGGFRTSERLSHAYVLSTAGVMLGASRQSSTQLTSAVTTLLISISIRAVKKMPWALALGHLVFFGGIDGFFFAASTNHCPSTSQLRS